MGHRQEMTKEQRMDWDLRQYQAKLDANKGSNFEYWSSKHDEMIENDWDLYIFINDRRQNMGLSCEEYYTNSECQAKEIVESLRSNNNFARIISGYRQTVQRVKSFSIIYKPKKTKKST